MTLSVLALVLAAAITHAVWNAWLKISGDRLVALATLAAGWTMVGFASLYWVGTPAREVWGLLAISTLVHTVYALTLIRAYGHGNLSVTYPIARGTGPLVVAIVSALFLGDVLGVQRFTAVLLIVAGVVWLGIPHDTQSMTGVVLSVITGILIGTYTLLDGYGGRLGDSPHSYVAWLLILTGIPIMTIAARLRGQAFAGLLRPVLPRGVIGGMLSAASYWVVIWAMSEAPMGLVAAVRETSVIFAALFGGALLKEPVRWAAVLLVLAGIVLTRLA
ncbi:MAG: EamA family transporter [Gammaproteobacteria bacterium]